MRECQIIRLPEKGSAKCNSVVLFHLRDIGALLFREAAYAFPALGYSFKVLTDLHTEPVPRLIRTAYAVH